MANYKDKDYLKREYVQNDRSAQDIAEENDCSPSTVYNWADKHGLQKNDTDLSPEDKEMITNAFVSERRKLVRKLGEQFGGERDLYENFGYKTEKDLGFQEYWNKYQRQDIASTIVDAPAQTTWRNAPEVMVDDEEWEEWESLVDRLSIYHYLERADRLSGIGEYGTLLIGTKGGDPLSQPLESVSGPEDIIYLSAFHQESGEIYEYVDDPSDERFGMPKSYMIDLTGSNLSSSNAEKKQVHWSRVIHVAEGKLEDEVFGEPRLKKVYNRLDDLMKVVGGSAEMFWQGAAPSFEIRADEDANIGDFKDSGLKEKIDEYIHNLRRYIPTAGASIETIDTEIEEPSDIVDILISLIASKPKVPPKRILMGSERGELASTQDEANWFGKMAERQTQFAEPEVLRPLIDRFIEVGALEEQDYEIEWPNLFELSALEEAELHAKNAKALKDASGGMPSDLATTEERREMLGLPKEMPDSQTENEIPLDEGNEQVRKQMKELEQ